MTTGTGVAQDMGIGTAGAPGHSATEERRTQHYLRVHVVPDSEAARVWDSHMAGFASPSFHQGYSWGEYRRGFGWRPLRLLLRQEDALMGMAQCLVREFPLCRTAVVWVPGGPLLNGNEWGSFIETMKARFHGRSLYIRIEPPRPHGDEEFQLMSAGWRPVRSRLNSGKTIVVSLLEDEPKRRCRLTGNWRHNLARGERRNLIVERWTPSPEADDALSQLYRDMVEFKGIPPAMDKDSIAQLGRAFGTRFIIIAVRSQAGKLLAARGGGLVRTMGYDLLAAASATARKTYASYVAMWRLLEEFQRLGAATYDLGGVDLETTPGVYHFKRGIGGSLVDRIGEWEWSDSKVLSLAVNAWVGRRIASLT